MTSHHIIIVDDEPKIRQRLKSYLEREGYRVSTASGGEELRGIVADTPADLVILDLVMPGEDGLSLTRYLRQEFDTGIIILTGKGEPVDRIVGLELGADDYIAKPFELRELLARVRSVLRRLHGASGERREKGTQAIFADWRFDLASRELTSPAGETVHLTTAEYNLLSVFVDNPNRPLNRDRLLDAVGGRDWQPYDRSIDLHVSHLRKKIEPDPSNPTLIKTVRGEGYVLTVPVDRA